MNHIAGYDYGKPAVEQHVVADVEQVSPPSRQVIKDRLFARQQPVVAAVQLVDLGLLSVSKGRRSLPLNDLPGENRGTAGRIGEVGLNLVSLSVAPEC